MEQQKDIIQAFIKLGCKCSNNGYHLYDIQNWLSDIKLFHISIYPKDKDVWNFEIYDVNSINKYWGMVSHYSEMSYKSPDEALEAGIWEAYYLINN